MVFKNSTTCIGVLYRLRGKLSEAVDQQRQLAQSLDDPGITGLPENQDPWYFETDKERIEFHPLPSKKAYAYYTCPPLSICWARRQKRWSI